MTCGAWLFHMRTSKLKAGDRVVVRNYVPVRFVVAGQAFAAGIEFLVYE